MGFPHSIGVSSALSRGAHYESELAIAQMTRLAAAVAEPTGRVSAQWHLAKDDAGYPALSGAVHGALRLRCQSCQKIFSWPLDLDVKLRLVNSEAEEAEVLKDHEPYLVQDDQLALAEVTEDEVLLALPLMPRCETCENNAQRQPQTEIRDEPARPDSFPGPFAALKKVLNPKS
jgi:uncharacterized protein